MSSSSIALRPGRILHVVSSLGHGGIELWLLQVLQTIDRDRYRMDFLVLNASPGPLEPELRRLGSQVITSQQRRNPWRLWRDFARVHHRHGPYDVIHSHVHHLNGLLLRLAAWHGVPVRVAHSHNDTRVVEANGSWRRQLYLLAMRRWIRRYATRRIAVSRSAAEDLFGADWSLDPRCEVIPCGIDFAAFAVRAQQAETRRALGLAEEALVLGHVGRFHARKNHRFLLEVAREMFAREERARLLLIGDGELLADIKARVVELGMANRVTFLGARSDVAVLMQAMDVFVFPSHHEGLGLVLLEAQASGLPCVLAESLPEEVDVVPALMHRLPLTAPAATWAKVALDASHGPRPSADQAWQALSRSPFTIERSTDKLARVYDLDRGVRQA